MGYIVNFDELDALMNHIKAQASDWTGKLEALRSAAEGLSGSSRIKGEGAENVKQYISSIHGTIIRQLLNLIALHSSNYLLYKQEYNQNVDTDLHANIKEELLQTIQESLQAQINAAIVIDGEAMYALGQIWDILNVPYRDISDVVAAHQSGKTFLMDLDDKIKQLEQNHLSSDFTNTAEMISALKSFIADASGTARGFKTSFTSDKISGFSSYQQLVTAQISVEKELNDKADAIKAAIENENQRISDIQAEDSGEKPPVVVVGGVEYKLGSPEEPDVVFDNDYAYDPNFKPTVDDYWNWFKWGIILEGAQGLAYLPDGCAAYERYREGTGEDLTIDYEKAYRQDEGVKAVVDRKLNEGIQAAIDYYGQTGDSSFALTGGATGCGANYPVTENWQKAIGGHYTWNSMEVSVNGSTMTIEITVHELDRYNFNKGMQDITTHAPDDVNGRFELAGWAKSFTTRGTVTRTITVNLDEYDPSDFGTESGSITIEGGTRKNIGEGENR